MEQINPKTYQLRLSDKYPGSPIIEHLKVYQENPPEFTKWSILPETRKGKSKEEYKVKMIVGLVLPRLSLSRLNAKVDFS